MEPGLNIDRHTCPLWIASTCSPIFSLSLDRAALATPCPFVLDASLRGLLRFGDRAHRTRAAPLLPSGHLALNECAGGAALDAEIASGACVVVDEKQNVGLPHRASELDVAGILDRSRIEHEDAVPRADVDATLAQDALLGDEVDEPLGLDCS